MREKTRIFINIFSLIFLSVAIFILLNSSQKITLASTTAGCGEYWGGNWTILSGQYCTVTNENIAVSKYLVLQSGSTLELNGTTNLIFGFKYRRPITISNSGSALNNYTVNVTLDTSSLISAGKMRSDCGDIRFGDADLNGYPYWIESGCNSGNTRIWVKVTTIPAGSKTIYVFYGNPGATSISNGTKAFDFFDVGDQTSSWTLAGTSGQDTSLGNPAPSYKAAGSSGSYMYRWIGLTPNSIVEYDSYSTALGNFFFLVYMQGGGQMMRLETRSGNSCGIGATTSWTSWNAPSQTCANIAANTWHKFKLVIGSTTVQAYINDVACGGAYTFSNNGGYIGLVGDTGGGQTNWDNIRVRKYASPEPTTSVGTEESNLPQYIYIYSGGKLYIYPPAGINKP